MKKSKTVCEVYGHAYHAANYMFSRTNSGKPFRGGPEWHGAAKFAIFVCGKCGSSIECQIGPALEDRAQLFKRPKTDGAIAESAARTEVGEKA